MPKLSNGWVNECKEETYDKCVECGYYDICNLKYYKKFNHSISRMWIMILSSAAALLLLMFLLGL